MLGRGFSRGEDQGGRSDVVVLSYGLWKSKFGGDPNIIGRPIQLNASFVDRRNSSVVHTGSADAV
jgi:hypothetical protein